MVTVASESPPRHPISQPTPSSDAALLDLGQLSRRDATQALLAAMATATDDERRVLEDRLVEVNLQIALDVARRYRSRGVSIEDLEQVASLGLVKAARGYDP